MKKPVLALIILFFSCSQPADQPKETTETPAVEAEQAETTTSAFDDLPEGAVREQFPDDPELTKVYVNSGPGNRSVEGIYKNGMRDGNWIEYHPNGLVKTITGYVDGKKEGLHVELSSNGTLTRRSFYHHNMRHGEYKEFNYTNVKEERFYQNDKLEGLVKIYYDNGKVMEEGNYKNGTRDGLSKWYDQNGKLSIEYEYKNGELVKK